MTDIRNSDIRDNAAPRRKSRLRPLAALFFVLGAVLLLFPRAVHDYVVALGSPDGIYIPNPRYEFSTARGGTLAHTFRVYNMRPRRLTVRAEPDCECTGVSWRNAIIAPFGWKDLTAQMEVRPDKTHLSRSVSIALRTDSRARPFLFMFLVG